MPASFTVSQSALTPAIVTVTDTSTSLSGTITQRRVYVQNANGVYLTPSGTTTDYTAWPLVDAAISLNILSQSTAALIRVDWLNVSDVVVDTLNNTYPLAEYDKQFFFYLVQLQGLQPRIPSDANYSSNMALYWTYITSGINAVTQGNSIAAGQNCFDLATQMRLDQNLYF